MWIRREGRNPVLQAHTLAPTDLTGVLGWGEGPPASVSSRDRSGPGSGKLGAAGALCTGGAMSTCWAYVPRRAPSRYRGENWNLLTDLPKPWELLHGEEVHSVTLPTEENDVSEAAAHWPPTLTFLGSREHGATLSVPSCAFFSRQSTGCQRMFWLHEKGVRDTHILWPSNSSFRKLVPENNLKWELIFFFFFSTKRSGDQNVHTYI